MSTLILLRGLSGAGKTTQAPTWATPLKAEILCPDDYRARMFGDAADQSDNQAVWRAVRQRAEDLLAVGVNVLIDATHTRPVEIEQWRPVAQRTGASVKIIEIHTPLAVALARNAQRARQVPEGVIRRQAESLAVPLPPANWYMVLSVAGDVDLPDGQVPGGYVTIMEAAQRTGKLARSIGTLADRGHVRTWINEAAPNPRRGRRLVCLADVERWYAEAE